MTGKELGQMPVHTQAKRGNIEKERFYPGLTLRQHIATEVLGQLVGNRCRMGEPSELAMLACETADALLNELAKDT